MITVLLAAGKASRMGGPKLILPYQGKSILEHSLEAALESSSQVILVTGYHEQQIRPLLSPYAALGSNRLRIISNPAPERGQFSSTLIGVAEVPENEIFTIAMGDSPLITSEHYRKLEPLLQGYEAVRPYCNDTPGHPVLCLASLRNEILNLPVSFSMRRFLAERNVRRFDTDDPAWITDIDTPESYERLLAISSWD